MPKSCPSIQGTARGRSRGAVGAPGLASPERLGRFYLPGLLANGTGRRRSAPLLGVTVHKQEPLPLRFSRRMHDLPLSAREGQACLLLLARHSRPTIAEKLGVSQHTAIAHT